MTTPKEYTEDEIKAMSNDELRDLVIESRINALKSFILLLEYQRRLHEVEFHGRTDETADELQEAISENLRNLSERIKHM